MLLRDADLKPAPWPDDDPRWLGNQRQARSWKALPTNSPAADSRVRVLTAYRARRQRGLTPRDAMESLVRWLHPIAYPPVEPFPFDAQAQRVLAEACWDHFYATRYLKVINALLHSKANPYWYTGKS